MSPFDEIRLVATRELRRSLRSGKGVAIAALTLVGTLAAALLSVWLENAFRGGAVEPAPPPSVDAKRSLLLGVTGDQALAEYLATIPIPLLIFLKVTIWLSPLVVALLGFDAVSGELQHRTVRYFTVRVRRASFYAGKLAGLWVLAAIVALVPNLVSAAIALSHGELAGLALAIWCVRFAFVVFFIAGAWASLATCISAGFETPILALLTTFAVFFGVLVAGVSGLVSRNHHAGARIVGPNMGFYEFLSPNAYDTLLLARDPLRVLAAVASLLVIAAVTSVAGLLFFARRDL